MAGSRAAERGCNNNYEAQAESRVLIDGRKRRRRAEGALGPFEGRKPTGAGGRAWPQAQARPRPKWKTGMGGGGGQSRLWQSRRAGGSAPQPDGPIDPLALVGREFAGTPASWSARITGLQRRGLFPEPIPLVYVLRSPGAKNILRSAAMLWFQIHRCGRSDSPQVTVQARGTLRDG